MLLGEERNILQRLTQSLTKHRKQKKPVVSIINVAEELLQTILGLLVDCDTKAYDDEHCDVPGISSSYRALQLSGTCRTFRYVLLRMSGAWTVLSSAYPGKTFLTMCVERSSSRGLRVYHTNFSDYNGVSKLLRHLESLPSVRIDLVSVAVRINHFTWSPEPISPEIEMLQLIGKLDNQFLSVLKIQYEETFRCSRNDNGGAVSNGSPFELRHLIRSPHLHSAHFRDTIPHPGIILSLSKLSLDIREDITGSWDVRDLLDLLRSLPTLEDFALEFYDTGSFNFNSAVNNRLELPSVKSLSLHWRTTRTVDMDKEVDYRDSAIPSLLRVLDMKNVKIFRFVLYERWEEDTESGLEVEYPLHLVDHLELFLGDNGCFPLLESFYLKFYSTDECHLHLPASYIQNIKHLSFDFNIALRLWEAHFDYEIEPRSRPTPCLPHLQTLTLYNFRSYMHQVGTMGTIVQAVEAGGNKKPFKQITDGNRLFLSNE
ncbi:hypothetical protein SCHPADRAFT_945602 [Schizopora paradoxa]|uniref:F-box domain-containing protein n=1 Tax=Schizopora paradoxa TaxID=27342 RepID=A0A0H2R6S6_9AGAM|nr:hypothetical protein SCHPADRAFT_945602 [Schizopora paradoxa]